MNKTTEALKLAEEALVKANHFHDYEDALAAIREALAEQEISGKHTCLSEKQEPVACVNRCDISNGKCADCPDPAPVDAKAIREQALEEAAKVCDDESRYSNDAECCAEAIRGLK